VVVLTLVDVALCLFFYFRAVQIIERKAGFDSLKKNGAEAWFDLKGPIWFTFDKFVFATTSF